VDWLYDAATSCGPVRAANEDAFVAGAALLCDGREGAREGSAPFGRPFIAAVADGMGGHAHGEVASALVVRCLALLMREPGGATPAAPIRARLGEALVEVHRSLCAMVPEGGRAPGSTVTGLYHDDQACFVFHAGDSRLYRFRGGALAQLTVDHTMRALYGGAYNRNVLYNCVGGGSADFELAVSDLLPPPGIEDLFMMVSDGVYDGLTDTMLRDALGSGKTAAEIVALAIAAGSQDNATVVRLGLA